MIQSVWKESRVIFSSYHKPRLPETLQSSGLGTYFLNVSWFSLSFFRRLENKSLIKLYLMRFTTGTCSRNQDHLCLKSREEVKFMVYVIVWFCLRHCLCFSRVINVINNQNFSGLLELTDTVLFNRQQTKPENSGGTYFRTWIRKGFTTEKCYELY